MRTRRKRGRKNAWQKKKVEGFFKTATEDLFDRARKEREGESRDILDGGDKYVRMEPHYTHVTSHYFQISSSTPQLAAVSQ